MVTMTGQEARKYWVDILSGRVELIDFVDRKLQFEASNHVIAAQVLSADKTHDGIIVNFLYHENCHLLFSSQLIGTDVSFTIKFCLNGEWHDVGNLVIA